MFGTRPDTFNESRNQSFEYDHLNRVTKAIGKYGEENYNYHRNGNLLNKGAFTYSYDNGNHIHAVTRVNSPNTGIVGYTYDSMGNMTTRNGDTLVYNAQNKLKRIETDGGDQFDYTYDHSGMRIKKALQNSNTTTYSFGNFYEIHRSPGQQEKHTLYVIGVEGDMVAQYSRPDAILLNQMASNSWMVNPFCKGVNIDCDTYWKNRTNFALISFLEDTNLYVDGKIREGHRAIPWVVLLGLLFWVVYQTKETSLETDSEERASNDIFGISILPNLTNYFQKQIPRYGTALFVVVFSFTTTAGCFPIFGGAEGETGTPIWLIGLGNGIPSDTQSVGNEPGQGGSGGGGSSSGNARVSGMFFFHPDHLGSITMITDGNGNVLAGGERGGKSHITYKPYGEILRTDSYGPDITKFKYTGQEEDQESGLYYYKARYYDASLGRFASNDGMVFPDKEQGMNRMMYVEGNPIAWRDQTGNRISTPLAWGLMGAVAAKNFGISVEEGFLLGYGFGRGQQRNLNSSRFRNTLQNTLGKNGLLGWTANNFYSLRKIGSHLYKLNHDYIETGMGERRKNLTLFLEVACRSKNADQTTCRNLRIWNTISFKNEEERFTRTRDPFLGMWNFKVDPINESRVTEEDVGYKNTALIWNFYEAIVSCSNKEPDCYGNGMIRGWYIASMKW
ncbi:RHS repeat-associated core domain-containing protein [Leptospira brenneri]|uniref:RHS repeat-associated core domain-containing protein n=1 Tax=Leptospira brenneri TaxID=2023182 RepID=UPI001FCADF8C|nr:RHS repeat-associated core domain-containing protein [Leptospira brenneri]